MRGSTDAERDELKTVTFLALKSLGPNGGAAVTRCDKTTLSNYHAQHQVKCFMPVDVVRDIEAALGRPVISEVLVKQAGWKCVPADAGDATAESLQQMIQNVADAEATLRLAFKRFMVDGIDQADRRDLRILIDELKADIADFERGL